MQKLKLGVSSYSFSKLLKRDWDYIKLCDTAKEIGFSGIEFTTLDQRYNKKIDVMEEAGKIRRHCEKIGLDIIAYTVGANLAAENILGEKEKLIYHIDVAKELGATLLRHDVCYLPPEKKDAPYREIIEKSPPQSKKSPSMQRKKGFAPVRKITALYFKLRNGLRNSFLLSVIQTTAGFAI